MIGLDSNILIRYLTHDDPSQTRRVIELIERQLTPESPGFISVVALAETIWVLRRSFEFQPAEIASALKKLLEVESFVVEHRDEVYSALRVLSDGRGSFADGLIAALGQSAGCDYTLTFDEKATRIRQYKNL